MKVLITIIQWLLLAGAAFAIWHYWGAVPLPTTSCMPGYAVILFALSIAFVWVEILKWGVTKPFNCVKCMSGWLALLLAIVFHTPHWYLYLPLGLFVGAIYSAIQMRWL